MKSSLSVILHDKEISDDEMTYLLMGLTALDHKFNLILQGFPEAQMGDDLKTITAKVMAKQMMTKTKL